MEKELISFEDMNKILSDSRIPNDILLYSDYSGDEYDLELQKVNQESEQMFIDTIFVVKQDGKEVAELVITFDINPQTLEINDFDLKKETKLR